MVVIHKYVPVKMTCTDLKKKSIFLKGFQINIYDNFPIIVFLGKESYQKYSDKITFFWIILIISSTYIIRSGCNTLWIGKLIGKSSEKFIRAPFRKIFFEFGASLFDNYVFVNSALVVKENIAESGVNVKKIKNVMMPSSIEIIVETFDCNILF